MKKRLRLPPLHLLIHSANTRQQESYQPPLSQPDYCYYPQSFSMANQSKLVYTIDLDSDTGVRG